MHSRDSSVGIMNKYGMGNKGIFVRFPTVEREDSLLQNVQIGYGAHSASYSVGSASLVPPM
jgi:hypothetical protein